MPQLKRPVEQTAPPRSARGERANRLAERLRELGIDPDEG
jgi:hypothetical protein